MNKFIKLTGDDDSVMAINIKYITRYEETIMSNGKIYIDIHVVGSEEGYPCILEPNQVERFKEKLNG